MYERGRILKYPEMCQAENAVLQKGMNYLSSKGYSIFLMSQRPGAPYRDRVEDGGLTLIYEGHDISKVRGGADPKAVDQPQYLPSGKLTENGKFFEAASRYKECGEVRVIRVYEKLRDGIWADNGDFVLVDAWREKDEARHVFKFKLVITESSDAGRQSLAVDHADRTRVIPSLIKQAVWLRDGGKCTLCDSATELHFDHIIPYSKGGSSLVAENIQLLCARHNLGKRDRIE